MLGQNGGCVVAIWPRRGTVVVFRVRVARGYGFSFPFVVDVFRIFCLWLIAALFLRKFFLSIYSLPTALFFKLPLLIPFSFRGSPLSSSLLLVVVDFYGEEMKGLGFLVLVAEGGRKWVGWAIGGSVSVVALVVLQVGISWELGDEEASGGALAVGGGAGGGVPWMLVGLRSGGARC